MICTPIPRSVDPILIVGAGQAGAIAALARRKFGCDVPIEIFGEERHAPYERPPLSKGPLSGKLGAEGLKSVLDPRTATQADIHLRLDTRVVAIDRELRRVKTDDGSLHRYSQPVLATGGTARHVPRLARGFGRVHVIRTADDAAALHGRLATSRTVFVLGGGWLGLEIAATARSLGKDVTVFVRQDRLCGKVLPGIVSDHLAELHRSCRVTLRLGVEPTLREEHDGVHAEGEGWTERADMLVVAIGMVANDRLARSAGLACADGDVTDEDGATEDPTIFAVGDVARQRTADAPGGRRIESWHNAVDQGRRAARRLLDLPAESVRPVRFWSHQFDIMMQIVGMGDPTASLRATETTEGTFWDFGSFAIGIDCPGRMRRFAAALSSKQPEWAARQPSKLDESTAAVLLPVDLGAASSVPEGEIVRFEPNGLDAVAVTRLSDRFFAVRDRCPHADASLTEGFIEGARIVCPLHFAEFDLETGAACNAPAGCPSAAVYPIEEREGRIFLLVPERTGTF